MNILDYKEYLGIDVNDNDKVNLFIGKINFCFREFAYKEYGSTCYLGEISDKSTRDYFYEQGQSIPFYSRSNSEKIYDDLIKVPEIYVYFQKLSLLLNCLDDKNQIKYFKKVISNILTETKISYSIQEINNQYYILSNDCLELDENLINPLFRRLENYPKSLEAFETAIINYSNNNNSSEIADLFRKALETFFKEFFNKECSLENMKKEYGTFLKKNGIPKEISNELHYLLNCYTDFNNNYAKHNDKTPNSILSYILYSTGNIINLLLNLKDN